MLRLHSNSSDHEREYTHTCHARGRDLILIRRRSMTKFLHDGSCRSHLRMIFDCKTAWTAERAAMSTSIFQAKEIYSIHHLLAHALSCLLLFVVCILTYLSEVLALYLFHLTEPGSENQMIFIQTKSNQIQAMKQMTSQILQNGHVDFQISVFARVEASAGGDIRFLTTGSSRRGEKL